MDPSLAALLGAVVGGLFTLSGSILASFIQSQKERERWIRDEKRKIYLSLIELTETISHQGQHGPVSFDDELFKKLWLRFYELKVFGSPKSLNEIEKALDNKEASEFYEATDIVVREAKTDLGIGH